MKIYFSNVVFEPNMLTQHRSKSYTI